MQGNDLNGDRVSKRWHLMNPEEAEGLKVLVSTKEVLGIICFSKHHNGRINCTRLSELLKVPINKMRELCGKLEAFKAIKVHKMGPDHEIELLDKDDEELKKIFDEAIWENKQEYGKIYKKLITAELLDFMGDK
jgi:hypothetical protein